MAKERDYIKEKELANKRGDKHYSFKLKKEDAELYDALLERFGCKTCGDFARKVAHGMLVVSERD